VTKIKNQFSCGCCWSFAIAAEVESFFLIKNGVTLDLSEQQLLDCNTQGMSCSGGWFTAYDFVVNVGFVNDALYPYTNTKGTCKTSNIGPVVAKIAAYVSLNGCRALQTALQTQPISIAINANDWSSYRKGVFNGPSNNRCNSTQPVNHAVVVVAWNNRTGVYTIKNSWGLTWGAKAPGSTENGGGYMHLPKGNCRKMCDYSFYAK